jgi:hypothetical protein
LFDDVFDEELGDLTGEEMVGLAGDGDFCSSTDVFIGEMGGEMGGVLGEVETYSWEGESCSFTGDSTWEEALVSGDGFGSSGVGEEMDISANGDVVWLSTVALVLTDVNGSTTSADGVLGISPLSPSAISSWSTIFCAQ